MSPFLLSLFCSTFYYFNYYYFMSFLLLFVTFYYFLLHFISLCPFYYFLLLFITLCHFSILYVTFNYLMHHSSCAHHHSSYTQLHSPVPQLLRPFLRTFTIPCAFSKGWLHWCNPFVKSVTGYPRMQCIHVTAAYRNMHICIAPPYPYMSQEWLSTCPNFERSYPKKGSSKCPI
jgi:hypothetical protein